MFAHGQPINSTPQDRALKKLMTEISELINEYTNTKKATHTQTNVRLL